jgi:tRNA threonylcarbamoyladenosine biosynthesis protein TsaB
MLVLALETVTRAGSIACATDRDCRAMAGDATRTHGERLPAEAIEWLSANGRALSDVDLFAIVAGPGSFTGLRVGVAAVQGFALAMNRRIVPIPTLDAIAASVLFERPDLTDAVLVACLDGQRGDLFFAAWNVTGERSIDIDRLPPVIEPSVGPPEDLAARLAGIEGRPVLLAGEAGKRVPLPAGSHVEIMVPAMLLAEAAARVARAQPERAVTPHAVRPIYIRRPDAVIARERARGAGGRRPPPAPSRNDTGLVISLAAPDDLPAVEALQRRTFTNPWGVDSIRWELENTDVARLHVARDPADGRVIAYCACWMVFDELHINSLAVDEGNRRRGIARDLLVAILRKAVAEGARSATLEVRQSNDAARALYEGLGFQVEAVRRDYYQQPREDALILWHRHLAD